MSRRPSVTAERAHDLVPLGGFTPQRQKKADKARHTESELRPEVVSHRGPQLTCSVLITRVTSDYRAVLRGHKLRGDHASTQLVADLGNRDAPRLWTFRARRAGCGRECWWAGTIRDNWRGLADPYDGRCRYAGWGLLDWRCARDRRSRHSRRTDVYWQQSQRWRVHGDWWPTTGGTQGTGGASAAGGAKVTGGVTGASLGGLTGSSATICSVALRGCNPGDTVISGPDACPDGDYCYEVFNACGPSVFCAARTDAGQAECTADNDCVDCAYPFGPERQNHCYCVTGCDSLPITRQRVLIEFRCLRRVVHQRALTCPNIACAPGPVSCVAGQCVTG